MRPARTRAATGTTVGLVSAALLTACGPQVAPTAAASDVATAEPLPTVTTAYVPETPIGMDLDTIDKLFASPIVDVVVQGTVTAVGFETASGYPAPMTRIVITVERARGSASREVTVWDSGGIVRESELQRLMSRPPKQGATTTAGPDPSPAPDRIIDMLPAWGAPRAAVGDRVVVFLHAVSTRPDDDGYHTVPGTLGRFTYDGATGEYVRAGKFSNWETVLTRQRVDRELTPLP